MNTQNEICLLADQELDAVVGGRAKLAGVNNSDGFANPPASGGGRRGDAIGIGLGLGIALDVILIAALG